MAIRAAVLAGDGVTVANLILVDEAEDVAGLGLVVAGDDVQIGWRRLGESFVPPAEETADVDALLAASAAARWRLETGGTTLAGVPVPTDERTQAVLTAAAFKAAADPAFAIPAWKTGPGVYVSLSAAEVIALADAVAAHVQGAFARNAEVDALILAGTLTSVDAVAAAYRDEE